MRPAYSSPVSDSRIAGRDPEQTPTRLSRPTQGPALSLPAHAAINLAAYIESRQVTGRK